MSSAWRTQHFHLPQGKVHAVGGEGKQKGPLHLHLPVQAAVRNLLQQRVGYGDLWRSLHMYNSVILCNAGVGAIIDNDIGGCCITSVLMFANGA